MTFADLIAPVPVERFMAEYYDRKPLLIPASDGGGEARRNLFSWARLNELMSIRSHWVPQNLKLILNSREVDPAHYLDEVDTLAGSVRRASTAKLNVFLGSGASLVANSVEDAAPEIRDVTAALAGRFLGRAGANAYCSFEGVQAFNTHCDLHEVFAVHFEGEKRWRVYENRAAAPVQALEGEGAQAAIDAARGRVAMDVTLRPGDLLYIPRGFFHDAIASSEASLHVTFSVAPHNARVLFRVLEERAMADPEFRAYLPDARAGEGAVLGERLERLAGRIAAIMRTPAFANDVAIRQRMLAEPAHGLTLPARPRPRFFARTGVPIELVRNEDGARVRAGAAEARLGVTVEAVEWLREQPAFSVEQMLARYPWLPADGLEGLVDWLRRAGALRPYDPGLS